jgi:hypothetical protein
MDNEQLSKHITENIKQELNEIYRKVEHIERKQDAFMAVLNAFINSQNPDPQWVTVLESLKAINEKETQILNSQQLTNDLENENIGISQQILSVLTTSV